MERTNRDVERRQRARPGRPEAMQPGAGSAGRSPIAPFDGAARITPAPENVACRWTPGPNGAGGVTVVYAGPLARKDEVCVRFGLQRQEGAPWSEVRELPMRRESGHTCIATLDVPAGAPLEAVQLAFRAGDLWDNGGRAPLGYYAWRVGDAGVRVP